MKAIEQCLSNHRRTARPFVSTRGASRFGLAFGLLLGAACGGKMDEVQSGASTRPGVTPEVGTPGAVPDGGPGGFSSQVTGGEAGQPLPGAASEAGAAFEGGAGGNADDAQSTKVDILLVVDNSHGMKPKIDKAATSAETLVTRLIQPRCLDANGKPNGAVVDQGGACVSGQREFAPVRNIHLGVITTSLGTRLSDASSSNGRVCDPAGTISVSGKTFSAHNDDGARLVNRAQEKGLSFSSMVSSGYLAFAGTGGETGSTSNAASFAEDVRAHVGSIDAYGCGVESPLESFYRFLIQPDPYESLAVSDGRALVSGLDWTLLEQRRRFLRPDSVVIVVQVSDESDAEIDVRAFGGQGYVFMDATFQPPRATSVCEADPASANCMSCAFPQAAQDPSCQVGGGKYTQPSDWGFNVGLRHVRMKQKYGLDLQFPMERYVRGLSETKVPDRTGEYPYGSSSYRGEANCTNPLFAVGVPNRANVTDENLHGAICDAPLGPRTPDKILFLHIGGVPWQLLVDDAASPQPALRVSHDANSWRRILGNDPERYDWSGIDPHMIESQAPRPGLLGPTDSPSDPMHGRDWITTTGDRSPGSLQYACIFDLEEPVDCTRTDSATQRSCACPASENVDPSYVPPVCDTAKKTRQVKSGAVPTTRQLMLARALGDRGLVASVCPLPAAAGAAYDPAITMLLARARTTLPQ